MVKITLDVDGMACGMCEAHVNEAVRKSFSVREVTSSHRRGKTEIISETSIDEGKLKKAIEETGYKVLRIHTEPYQKGRFGFLKK